MRVRLVALLCGVVFAAGLGLSGMTKPAKVIGFLDFFGAWDPSLALVMVGAIGVNAAVYWGIVRKRSQPVLADRFHFATQALVDRRLVLGSAIFGVGWGLGGYCPGPAVVSLMSGGLSAAVFVGAMLAGMWILSVVEGWLSAR